MEVRVGLWRKLSTEELMLLNCGVGEDSRVPWTARRSNQSILKQISPGCSLENWCWSWNSNTLATWCEELTHWKRPWCWEGLGTGGEWDEEDEMVGWHHWLNGCVSEWTLGDGDGQGGLACCDSWGHRVRHDWVTELKYAEQLKQNSPMYIYIYHFLFHFFFC